MEKPDGLRTMTGRKTPVHVPETNFRLFQTICMSIQEVNSYARASLLTCQSERIAGDELMGRLGKQVQKRKTAAMCSNAWT
jgi:hypothetical protein